jgi:dihydroorotate dehydrogenase
LKLGLSGSSKPDRYDGFGEIERFGLRFTNPLGIAAGFDKNGVVVNQLASLGFAFVEVGTVTYDPQSGNPMPRMFRLPDDQAIVNRLGFNNDGAAAIAERLATLDRRCVIGVNIGRNKDVNNEDATENYVKSFEIVHPVADYIAVNVSSPNTPNLRELQLADNLDNLLGSLDQRNRELGRKPLLVKIAPDVNESDIEALVHVAQKNAISGVIATNTTVSRDGLTARDLEKIGAGGVSGRPLAKRSTEVISTVYRYSKGKLPIIGVGGVFSGLDAFDKIAAGASLVQAYTGFVYAGPSFARRVNLELAGILKRKGFQGIDEAVGSAE